MGAAGSTEDNNSSSLDMTDKKIMSSPNNSSNSTKKGIRVAHIGNSIQYYNDCPRLLEHLFRLYYQSDDGAVVHQDSCLRGGASLTSLPKKGNGMAEKFHTPTALRPDGTYDVGSPTVASLLSSGAWDVVVMNDHTQAPAREEQRAASLTSLQEIYLPLLTSKSSFPSVVVFLMTAAYRQPVKNADELGSFEEFTQKLHEGYQTYQQVVPNSKIAPVGWAFAHLHKENHDMWERLYAHDGFHPSPHGTLLEAYVLFATITGEAPPTTYSPEEFWKRARYMQPPDEPKGPLPLPTEEDASLLRGVACMVCNVATNGTCLDDEDEDTQSRL